MSSRQFSDVFDGFTAAIFHDKPRCFDGNFADDLHSFTNERNHLEGFSTPGCLLVGTRPAGTQLSVCLNNRFLHSLKN